MCGIFAAINENDVTPNLIEGLRTLEYRGYDSAGIAVLDRGSILRRRAEGKLKHLEHLIQDSPVTGTVGIAHTRWATHGAPTTINAHPHMTQRVAVVHNGIIENHQQLRSSLIEAGHVFHSETDSEILPVLICNKLGATDDSETALRQALAEVEGSYAISVVFADEPECLYASRLGSPLVIGRAAEGHYLASDANALSPYCDSVIYLEDGDLARICVDEFIIKDKDGKVVTRDAHQLDASLQSTSKDGYVHHMLKEIHEQPAVIARAFEAYTRPDALPFDLNKHPRLSMIACGTSYYAGMTGKYLLERIAHMPVDLDIASEYRYRGAPLSPADAAVFISQSGETADTLSAMRHAASMGQRCISIVNVQNSSMSLESDDVIRTHAGTEIGVASTKAFTAQLAALSALTIHIAAQNGKLDGIRKIQLAEQISTLPAKMQSCLADDSAIRDIARQIKDTQSMLYLGRGHMTPLALEGALKLKEISYIHAEAYPAGELKHGPIALIDEHMPVVMIAPPGELFLKSLSNLREIASRGARIILISDAAGTEMAAEHIEHSIVMPQVDEILEPILYSLPLQLLAYHVADLKGMDVDQPRNLAKSVTVE